MLWKIHLNLTLPNTSTVNNQDNRDFLIAVPRTEHYKLHLTTPIQYLNSDRGFNSHSCSVKLEETIVRKFVN